MALADQIVGVESGNNPTAKNPRSSATGGGQFIASTWLSTIAKHRPDLAGLPRDEVLALRNNLDLSRQMTQAYADDNGAVLRSAGFDPTPGNTYLAHFAGPAGAKAVLGADPSTPVTSILDRGAVAANPFLQPMTAGDLTAWASRKMGGKAPVMTLPGESTPAARMPFSLAGPVGSSAPAPTIPAEPAKADSGPDLGTIMKMLGASQSAVAGQAAPEAVPLPAPAPPPAPRPQAFDARKFFALLPSRR